MKEEKLSLSLMVHENQVKFHILHTKKKLFPLPYFLNIERNSFL